MEYDIYKDTIENLRLLILQKFGSIRNFAKIASVDQFNLSRVFNGKHEMSVGLFMTICHHLGFNVLPPVSIAKTDLSLRHYLGIDNNAVFKNVLKINMS